MKGKCIFILTKDSHWFIMYHEDYNTFHLLTEYKKTMLVDRLIEKGDIDIWQKKLNSHFLVFKMI